MSRPMPKKSRGSVLIVSLVILLVLTLLGLSGMGDTVLQERMAGNLQESMSAFQAAEAGLRDGETDATENITIADVFKPDCTDGLCEPADPATDTYDVWQVGAGLVTWATYTNAIEFGDGTGANDLQNVSQNPAYIIERLQVVERGGSLVTGFQSQPQNEWYRITARGFGRNGQSQATVQSVIRK